MMELRRCFIMDQKNERRRLDRKLAPCTVRIPSNAPVYKRKKLPRAVLDFPGYVEPGRSINSTVYFNQRRSETVDSELQSKPFIFNRNPILQSARWV